MSRPEFTVRIADWHHDRSALRTIREQVFMAEQGVSEELEWDGEDEAATHLLAFDHTGQAIGTARMLHDGHIGRMSVVKSHRTRGVGSALLRKLIEIAEERSMSSLNLDAQTHAIGFYERFGFTAEGDTFLDANIPHQRMRRGL